MELAELLKQSLGIEHMPQAAKLSDLIDNPLFPLQ